MTDNDIIKALECYIKENEFEYFHSNTMCEYPLIRKALNLINRQKAEIARLLTENKMLLTRLTRLNEEIAQPYLLINADAESTAKMIEALKTQKTLIVPGNEATVEFIDKASIKAEAVKATIEAIKNKSIYRVALKDGIPIAGSRTYHISEVKLYEIAKEMVGADGD